MGLHWDWSCLRFIKYLLDLHVLFPDVAFYACGFVFLQLDVEIEIIRMELSETSGMFQHLMRDKHGNHHSLWELKRMYSSVWFMISRWKHFSCEAAEIGSVTHEAQICAENRNGESEASTLKDINSPEQWVQHTKHLRETYQTFSCSHVSLKWNVYQ